MFLNYKTNTMSRLVMARILLILFLLESCTNFSIPVTPKIPKEKELLNINLGTNKQIDSNRLVGQELTASGGNLVSFYEEAGKLRANVRVDEAQKEPNYRNLPVTIEEGSDLAQLPHLTRKAQQLRIQLERTQGGQLSRAIVLKGGLLGGMMEEEDNNQQEKKESKGKEKEEIQKKASSTKKENKKRKKHPHKKHKNSTIVKEKEEEEKVKIEEELEEELELGISSNILFEDNLFNEYLNTLPANEAGYMLKEYLSSIKGGQGIKKNYAHKSITWLNSRKPVILLSLLAAGGISAIGSLTFLIGSQFPEEFANLAGFHISDDATDGIGNFLGWSNVVIEALFYTWSVSGMLPPLQPERQQAPPAQVTNGTGFFRQYYTKFTSWLLPENNEKSFLRQYCTKIVSWLSSWGEWGLATASALPLTLLSVIDQENGSYPDGLKYTIVACIGLITLISNKFFLGLTHGQFKNVCSWLWSNLKKPFINPPVEENMLEQVKIAFLEATIRADEKVHRLSRKEFKEFISSLKVIAKNQSDAEDSTSDEESPNPHSINLTTYGEDPAPDRGWVNLLNYMYEDLSCKPAKVPIIATMLVPAMGIFAALSWIGLIATVPGGVEEKLSSSPAVQYILMIVAAIPLLEIGLSLGGSFGLTLSKICQKSHSLTNNLTNWGVRLLGYVPITAIGLASFGTNATLTIQQFKSVPAIAWMLLPSATLGIDLINISSGIELWNEILIAVNIRINSDKALLVNHIKFMQTFQEKLKTISSKEITALLLNLEPSVQEKIVQFVPNLKDKELSECINALKEALKAEMSK